MAIERQSEILGILVKEYFHIKEGYQSNISRVEKGLAFFLISISIAFGVGIKERICELLLIIPWLTIGFAFYSIMFLDILFTDDAYAATIASRINNLLDSEVLSWELKIAKKLQHFTWPAIMFFVIFFVIFIMIVFIAAINSSEQYPKMTLINSILIIFFNQNP